LRKYSENFLNTAVRALKHGRQQLGNELHTDIGFLFKKQATFEKGIADLQTKDPLLSEYLRQTRIWSERLVAARNNVEHNGWMLPRVAYEQEGGSIIARQPQISDLEVTQFVNWLTDRLCCFAEEFTMHCLQRQLPDQITVAQIPRVERDEELPMRFILTIGSGGMPRWNIGVSGEGHITQSVEVRPRSKDSDLVAWEAPRRESKTVEPSDPCTLGVLQRTRL
jgi:hypothetical protein